MNPFSCTFKIIDTHCFHFCRNLKYHIIISQRFVLTMKRSSVLSRDFFLVLPLTPLLPVFKIYLLIAMSIIASTMVCLVLECKVRVFAQSCFIYPTKNPIYCTAATSFSTQILSLRITLDLDSFRQPVIQVVFTSGLFC